jgi:cytochrome P450 family 135
MTLPPGSHAPTVWQTRRFLSDPVELMEDARRRYGETFTVRIARAGHLVFLSDPPSIKALFAADRNNIVAPGRNVVLEPLLGSHSLLLINGPEHLARRKLMLPPFHGERMRAYERVMEEATERQIDQWKPGNAFALHPSMQAITLEVIMRAVFGVREDQDQALRTRLTEILAATRSPFLIGFGARIPGIRRLPRIRRVERWIAETDAILAELIAAHRADPDLADREDILSMLLLARDERGEGMDDTEIRDQLMTLLLAGHETTATGLAWAFDLLFRNPAAMERLLAEVGDEEGGESGDDRSDGGLKRGEGANEGKSTAYLDAVVEETLRLRPVVLFVGRQLQKPTTLGGYDLPVGTVVGPSIYLAHTRPDVFPDPYTFRPERFLAGSPETYSWIPFGGGTRRCIGAAFAQFEMRVVLRTILRQAELRPASPEPEQIVRRNVTLSPRHGTPAVLARRLREPARAAA